MGSEMVPQAQIQNRGISQQLRPVKDVVGTVDDTHLGEVGANPDHGGLGRYTGKRNTLSRFERTQPRPRGNSGHVGSVSDQIQRFKYTAVDTAFADLGAIAKADRGHAKRVPLIPESKNARAAVWFAEIRVMRIQTGVHDSQNNPTTGKPLEHPRGEVDTPDPMQPEIRDALIQGGPHRTREPGRLDHTALQELSETAERYPSGEEPPADMLELNLAGNVGEFVVPGFQKHFDHLRRLGRSSGLEKTRDHGPVLWIGDSG